MNINRLLYHNIFWRMVNLGSVFLLNILIAQIFGAEQYGKLFYFVNALTFVLTVVSFSFDSGLGYYSAKNQLNDSASAFSAIFWAITGSLLAVTVLYFFIGKTDMHNVTSRLSYAFMYICGMLLLTFFTALFSAKFHYFLPNITIAFCNVVLGYLAYLYKNSFNGFVSWFFILVLVQGLVMAASYCLQYVKRINSILFSKEECRKIMRYASVAFLSNITFFLVYRIDYWLVNHFVKQDTATQLGNYIQVSKIVQIYLLIPSIIASTVFSLTAAGTKIAMLQKTRQLSNRIFVVAFILCIPLVIFGKWLFPFAFGPSFTQMYEPFLFLIPGIIALAMQSPISAYNAGNNRQITNLTATFFALVIIIAGDFICIPIWGINGAAAVCSVGYTACTLYLLYVHYIKEKQTKFE